MTERGFHRTDDGLAVSLESGELGFLIRLSQDLTTLITSADNSGRSGSGNGSDVEQGAGHDDEQSDLAALVGIDTDAIRPDDPALARLFPDAYRDDDEASAEFRRFTQRGLRDRRMDALSRFRDLLSDAPLGMPLSEEDAGMVLAVLNDMRLVLGTRLGIEEDDDPTFDELPEDDPRFGPHNIYQWLTALQSQLLQGLMGS